MVVIVVSVTLWIVKVPATPLIVISWVAAKPAATKLPSSEPAARLMTLPVIVMLPVNSASGPGAPIARLVTRTPGVMSVWPSVIRFTFTVVSGAGACVRRIVYGTAGPGSVQDGGLPHFWTT